MSESKFGTSYMDKFYQFGGYDRTHTPSIDVLRSRMQGLLKRGPSPKESFEEDPRIQLVFRIANDPDFQALVAKQLEEGLTTEESVHANAKCSNYMVRKWFAEINETLASAYLYTYAFSLVRSKLHPIPLED